MKKFELVEFYPFRRNPKRPNKGGRWPLGTLHLYLIEEGADLRGVGVYVTKKSGIFFKLPMLSNYDPEIQKTCGYPVFIYQNEQKLREFEEFIKLEGTPIVEKYLQEHPEFDKRLKTIGVKND